jgi:RES domain-containing protein
MGNKLEKITLWRLDRERYVNEDSCLSGNGGLYNANRWSKKGETVVYTAANISLAFLEIYHHLDFNNPTLNQIAENSSRRIVQLYLDDLDYQEINMNMLSTEWREIETSQDPKKPSLLQKIGSKWFRSGITPVLKVPSAIVPYEFNYLINPNHPDITGRLSLQNPMNNLEYPGMITTKVLPEPFIFDNRYIQLRLKVSHQNSSTDDK